MNTVYSPVVGQLRIFDEGTVWGDPYVAVATVVWWHQDVAYVTAMHGKASRQIVREIIKTLGERGARLIYADRAGRHRLPFADKLDVEYGKRMWVIDVAEVVAASHV